MKVAVVTSAYGEYDEPSVPVEQTIPVEYVLVTDRDHLAPLPWRTVFEPRPQLHPRLAAKVAKCRPDLYTDADVIIWMDASMEITSPEFAMWCVETLAEAPLAQIPHPERQCILPEASVSSVMGKYAGLPVLAQAESYIAAGHPRDWGLWATGLIVYNAGTWIRPFGDSWLREQVRWSYQDQLSQAPLLRIARMRPTGLPGRLWGHDKFAIRRHRDGS